MRINQGECQPLFTQHREVSQQGLQRCQHAV
jgi:hypothetical protein